MLLPSRLCLILLDLAILDPAQLKPTILQLASFSILFYKHGTATDLSTATERRTGNPEYVPLFLLTPSAIFLLFPGKMLEQNRALGNQCEINRF